MRVCQFRHFGKSDSDAAIVAPPSRRVIFYSIACGERGSTGDGVAWLAQVRIPETRTGTTASKHGSLDKEFRSMTWSKSLWKIPPSFQTT